MPVLTRQTSPGPSTAISSAMKSQAHSLNAKKRAGAEIHEEMRDSKKIKGDGDVLSSLSISKKDKKKKKRRKKRRSSSIIQFSPQTSRTIRVKVRSASAPLTNGQRASRTLDESIIDSALSKEADVEKDKILLSSSSDKGKGKANGESPPHRGTSTPRDANPMQPVASGSSSAMLQHMSSQASEIARLKEQLVYKDKLLNQHQAHFTQHQQSLTCQICLDLMYKPYALSPCGHITCYGCLVRWFTTPNAEGGIINNGVVDPALDNPDNLDTLLDSAPARNGAFVRRRKKCPVCRAIVAERPIEMWGMKDMVSAFVRSGLADVSSAPLQPVGEEGANDQDPWRNVFRKIGHTNGHFHHPFGAAFNLFPQPMFPPPRPEQEMDREEMGWYDAEDGGIYRCTDCYHEIWGGVCTGCDRRYAGHGLADDDDDDDSEDEEDDDGRWFVGGPMNYDRDENDDEDEDDHGDIYIPPWIGQHQLFHHRHDSDEDDIEDDIFGLIGMERRFVDNPEDQSDSEAGDTEIEDHPYFGHGMRFNGGLQRRLGRIQEVVDDDEGEDDEDSVYGGSFIDDEEEIEQDGGNDEIDFVETLDVRPPRRRIMEGPHNEDEEIGINDDEDEDDDGEGEPQAANILRRYLRGRYGRPHARLHPDIDLNSDDSTVNREEDEETHLPRHGLGRQHRRRVHLISDDEENDDS